jgi:hypothetical protein
LPDLNAIWVTYRNRGLAAISGEMYAQAIGCINGMNAILPNDYRIEVNTSKYTELTTERLIAICNACKEQFSRKEIKIVELLNPLVIQVLTNQEYEKVWFCPKCNKTNNVSTTNWIKERLGLPYYLKVIPEPPSRKGGIQDRREYPIAMEKWFYQALEELDHQLGTYRADYVSQLEQLEQLPQEGTPGEEEFAY